MTVDAEARGRVRAFKRELAAEFRRVDARFRSVATRDVAERFVEAGRLGKARAAAKLEKLFGPADRRYAGTLVWPLLRPREAVIRSPRDAGQVQDAVVIDFVAAGRLGPYHHLEAGLWTVEAPDHALHRLVQRHRSADLRAVLLEAHREVLAAAGDVLPDPDEEVLVRAGPGAFIGELIYGHGEAGELLTYYRARTWYHETMLEADRELLLPGPRPLGLGPLLPAPLRRITSVRGAVIVQPLVSAA